MITCKLCGKEFKSLPSHINFKHAMTKDDYISKFPGEKIIDDELSKSFSENSKKIHQHLKNIDPAKYRAVREQTCKTMRDKKGPGWTHSNKTKKQMAESHLGRSAGPHTDETKKKISNSKKGKSVIIRPEAKAEKSKKQQTRWTERKQDSETYQAYITAQSSRRKQYISENGHYASKKESTNIENEFANFLIEHDIEYAKQYVLDGKIFDFYLPVLNILVETDGEYWHRFPKSIDNDVSKHSIAQNNNIELLRLSSDNFCKSILFEDRTIREEHSLNVLRHRGVEL